MWERSGRVERDGAHKYEWCICRCGAAGMVRLLRDGSLRTKSCRKCTPGRPVEHGGCVGSKGSPEYKCWSHMISRTTRETDPDFHAYGGRGILVCEGWRSSFPAFRDAMGRRPRGMTLDRRDNERGYDCGACADCVSRGATSNCRWATPHQQGANTRRNRVLEHNGHRLTMAQWARITGIKANTIKARLRYGFSTEEALTRPVDRGSPRS